MPVASFVVKFPIVGPYAIKVGRFLLGLDKKQNEHSLVFENFVQLDLLARLEQLEVRMESLEALSSNYKESTPLMLRNMRREINNLKNLGSNKKSGSK